MWNKAFATFDKYSVANACKFIEINNLAINGNGQALILRMHYLEDVEIEDGHLMVAS
ncbi:hypothetical protein [Endozoicomonas atrinae]|uniref:hypothetical protein n=1 Tax=Endozoicomonas atrinae TaxID=1333660 RepID=UPI003B00F495